MTLLWLIGESYESFFIKVLLKKTGNSEMRASRARIKMDAHDMCPVADVISYRVVPARMKRNDGGATPINVPTKNGVNGTPMTGDAMLMNQLGRNGVILRKTM
jgi:hypothetical protein